MRTMWKAWAGFRIQVRQQCNTVQLTSGVGHLGRPQSSNGATDKAKLMKLPVMYLISRQHSMKYRRTQPHFKYTKVF